MAKYCNIGGFSYHTVSTKGPDINFDFNDVLKCQFDFIMECRDKKLLENDPEAIACMDFMYNSHRGEIIKSLSPRGGNSPKGKINIPEYTSCFVLANKMDGTNLPTIMFTSDPRFDVKKLKKNSDLEKIAKEYNILLDRINYVEGEGTKKFIREPNKMIKICFDYWGNSLGSRSLKRKMTVFSDQGNSYKRGKIDVIEEQEVKTHITFPPLAHPLLSTLDNGVIGVAKSKWKAANIVNEIPYDDEPRSSLYLMKCCDDVTKEEIKNFIPIISY